jgi:hypothetical protein
MDFLVSDAEVKSGGQVHFPSQYAQGYAYLASKVYGDRAGTVFGAKDVHLWMPRQLLTTNNIQVNYVAGYDARSLYVVLLNQSRGAQTAEVTLNPGVVPINSEDSYPMRVLSQNGSAHTALEHGKVVAQVPSSGVCALAIDGIKITPQFQLLSREAETSETVRFAVQQTPVGKVTSMLLSLGPDDGETYTWLEATEDEGTGAILHCMQDDGETTRSDFSYPYEFSVPLLHSEKSVELWVDTITTAGNTVSCGHTKLMR